MTIHKVGDGLGFRKVYGDGVEIEKAFYADTDTGEVQFYQQPLQMVLTGAGEQVLAERKFFNEVKVEFEDEHITTDR